MISRKHLVDLMFLLIVSAVWFIIGWFIHGRIIAQNPESMLIEQVRQTLLDNYIDNLPSSRELTYGALRGMVHQLDDPYAAFLDPFLAARFQEDFNGNSGVIGLFPEQEKGEFVVTVVLPGGAAEAAGLQVGDIIESVDGVAFDPLTTAADVSLLFRGPVGTPADVVIRRDGERMTFSPVRNARDVVSEARMLEGDIAYFAQHTFTANAPGEVTAVLQDLLAQQPRGLIWDLRSNGGGSLEAAQEIMSMFIQDGLLFQIELKDGELRQVEASGNSIASEIPLVVLVSGTTFSAAETSAAAIQERQRGTLIGETTFGKGTVQTTMPMPQETAVQFTIAHWLSPQGVWYDGRGVEPDLYVVDDPETAVDEVLAVAMEWLSDQPPAEDSSLSPP